MANQEIFELMLNQLYQQLEGNNDDDSFIGKKIPQPQIKPFPRKIHWTNYYETVKALNIAATGWKTAFMYSVMCLLLMCAPMR